MLFYERMVYINNIVDVKQKQTLHKWDPILKCE